MPVRIVQAMTGPRYPDLIARLPETVPFVGPEVQERARGAKFRARLGANESVFGPSPFAIAAMQAGKHVICEMPFAPNMEDVDKMLAVAKETESSDWASE